MASARKTSISKNWWRAPPTGWSPRWCWPNFTNEGEATAHYISEMLKARGLRVSRLARGVPVGGELEYVDAGTIARAMLDRRAT